MTTLFQAINQESTTTENGMPTLQTSLNDCVDLFFKIGASRGKDIIPLFSKAFNSENEIATRIALWARDVRGGAGERKLFRDILSYLVTKDVDLARKVMVKVPELGRWDDLFVLFGTALERDALRLIADALKAGNGLCAKWMPRKSKEAGKIRAYLQLSPKAYRKLLVGLTNVVETKMCAKEWESIEFGKLPSLASARYQTAFLRNAPVSYTAYKDALVKGEAKINAGAVYPYDIVKTVKKGDQVVADAQWKALPDYLAGNTENLLCLVDVSDSMDCPVGGTAGLSCMDAAISLGLYISERSKGIFKDQFITFHERPSMLKVYGSLSDRYHQMKNSPWGGSTNLESAFRLILDSAVKHKVAASEMPTTLIILSDMQFNVCDHRFSDNSYQMIDRMYEQAGYKRPSIVYWNLRDSHGVPVTFDQAGTALVSGFSPSIMESVLSGKGIDPVTIMLQAVMKDRYQL